MRVQTLFRIGAAAAIITALGDAVGNLIYFSGRAQTLFFAWFFIAVTLINVFAVIALFAAQANREEIVTFFGFVLLFSAWKTLSAQKSGIDRMQSPGAV